MKIENLAKTLDAKTMTAVRGGDNGTAATSNILQAMGIQAPIGIDYGAGSAGNTFININGSQDGSVSNKQTSGDKFSAFLGSLRGLEG